MLKAFKLIRNTGQFDSVSAGATLPLTKLSLIYAENGRGKTTLAAILRSLGTGDGTLIQERGRLGASNAPHIVIDAGAAAPAVFQTGAWSATSPELAVFDDHFVASNVCSGLAVDSEHRQNLHELILGAQGVALNTTLEGHIQQVEAHNKTLREKERAIPAAARGSFKVDDFCALERVADIDEQIEQAERALAAAQSADSVRRESTFDQIRLPAFDVPAIEALLNRTLDDVDAEALSRVQSHLAQLGPDAEAWVSEGMQRIQGESCPFCAQDLGASPILAHYRAYFSEAYGALKAAITQEIASIDKAHGGNMAAAFERAVRVALQRREFWRAFCGVPAFEIDTAAVLRTWNVAGDAIHALLRAKEASPLEAISIDEATRAAVERYDQVRQVVQGASAALEALNPAIALVKEQAASADVAALSSDLAILKCRKARYEPATDALCQDYLTEKTAKTATEGLRDAARTALDAYRQNVFPAYEAAINHYLGRFYAGFRLGSVTSVNTRTGSTCSYAVVINNVPVPVTAGGPGTPSFRTTLSAGDRNTLALAFFFASLDQDPNLPQKIVVIDDPMTSLDEHRSLATIQELRRLAGRVDQVIVLSHSKPFLCEVWEAADTATRTALKLVRDTSGSTLATWDVRQDCISMHDKRHEMVRAYMGSSGAANERDVAAALRPILENFMRVAYPSHFPPGSLLGPFIGICQQRVGTVQQVLSAADIAELRDLLDYANKFHHDSNAAWETEVINDQQLTSFCDRTLRFARRP